MKTTANLMLIGAMLVSSSCDLFVPPKVACDEIVLVPDVPLSSQAQRKGSQCAFGPLAWQVAHAPKVDEKWASENGGSGNKSLANMPVRVTGIAAALCDGVACAPTEPQIDIHVDEMGLLTYGAQIPEFTVGEGDEADLSGIIINEVYGPGNECPIKVEITASCATAPDTANQ